MHIRDEHFTFHYNVDSEEEEDLSEANIFVNETSKLSSGARIFRGP